jgi:Bacterial Ig domain/Secretion system C-terminal sorting domain/PKD domain
MKFLKTLLFTLIAVISFGQEICNNNIDDNFDGLVDCDQPSCQFATTGNICNCANSNVFWYMTFNRLYVANLVNGIETNFGSRNTANNAIFHDLAWIKTGVLYALGKSGTSVELYTISANLGNSTPVLVHSLSSIFSSANAMVSGNDNFLYIVGQDILNPNTSLLIKIDPNVGLSSVVNLGTFPQSTFGASSGDLAFTNGNLYWTTTLGLVSINLQNTAASTLLPNTCVVGAYGIFSGKDGLLYAIDQTTVNRINPNLATGCTPILALSQVPTGCSKYNDWGQTFVDLSDGTIASGSGITLTPNIITQSQFSYLWTGGATTSTLTVSPNVATSYCVTVTDIVNGCSNIDCATVTVNSTWREICNNNIDDNGDGLVDFNDPICLKFLSDINNTLMNTPVSGNVRTNDDYVNIAPSLSIYPQQGNVVFNTNGFYTYTPNPNFVGKDSFYYELNFPLPAGGNRIYSLSVVINVLPLHSLTNHPPFTSEDHVRTFKNAPVGGNIFNNDIDQDGDVLTLATAGIPLHGTLSIVASGQFSYTPDANYVGNDFFRYMATDGRGGYDENLVFINVSEDWNGATNNAPFAHDDAFVGTYQNVIVGNLSLNDRDLNGNPITFSLTPSLIPQFGTLVIQPNGAFVFTPNNGYIGPDRFEYIVCDNGGLCDTATCYLLVMNSNCNPFFEFVVDSIMPPWTIFGTHNIQNVVSFFWDFGDGSTSTDPYPTHIYATLDTFEVCLTTVDANGCVGIYCDSLAMDSLGNILLRNGFTLTFRPLFVTGITSIPNSLPLKSYPNPTTEVIQIEYELEIAGQIELKLCDILGNTILEKLENGAAGKNISAFDLSEMPPGVYLLNVQSQSSKNTIRIIKQ